MFLRVSAMMIASAFSPSDAGARRLRPPSMAAIITQAVAEGRGAMPAGLAAGRRAQPVAGPRAMTLLASA